MLAVFIGNNYAWRTSNFYCRPQHFKNSKSTEYCSPISKLIKAWMQLQTFCMLDSNQSNCLQTLEILAPADCTQVFSLWLTFAEPDTVNLVIQIVKSVHAVSLKFPQVWLLQDGPHGRLRRQRRHRVRRLEGVSSPGLPAPHQATGSPPDFSSCFIFQNSTC